MSARTIAVLDRKLRAIDDRMKVLVAVRCDILREELILFLPPRGPMDQASIDRVNECADDVAAIGREGMREAYSESLTTMRRDLIGILSTVGRMELETEIMGSLYRAAIFHNAIGLQSEYITTTTERVLKESDRQWGWALMDNPDDLEAASESWRKRLTASGKVGEPKRRGRSLYSVFPGLLRVSFIDNMWGMVNDDRQLFGDTVSEAIARG